MKDYQTKPLNTAFASTMCAGAEAPPQDIVGISHVFQTRNCTFIIFASITFLPGPCLKYFLRLADFEIGRACTNPWPEVGISHFDKRDVLEILLKIDLCKPRVP